MQYAAEQGWVEVRDRDSFKLTELGFSNAREEEMNLLSLCTEKVTLERKDGSRHENLPAKVTRDMVLVADTTVPIAPNDVILREIPSGLVERLVVKEPGFNAEFHGIPAHYQVKYRQEGQEPAGTPGYVVHITGNNPRVKHSVY